LERLSKGELPQVDLLKSSEDFSAIQRYLGVVIKQTDEKVRIIEAQSKALVQAEQQRVMAETVGAACHHLGQPATVIRVYLDLMKKVEASPEMKAMIQECQSAVEEVAGILERLQGVGQYQTEPYLGPDTHGNSRAAERILKI
jgi:signal transduction histidine kinase